MFEAEPLPPDSPLWAMPNVIVSPHSASTVTDENELITELFIDNLGRWLAGQPLRNVFDKDGGLLTRPPNREAGPSDDIRQARVSPSSARAAGPSGRIIPGWQRDGRAEVVALSRTPMPTLWRRRPPTFGVPRAVTDYRELLDDPGIDVVDVVTGNRPHYEVSLRTRCRPASTCCARSRCTPITARPGMRPSSPPPRA